jgi:arginine decarboxylase-like protein
MLQMVAPILLVATTKDKFGSTPRANGKLELGVASMLPMVTKRKARDVLESVQLLHFFSPSRTTAAVTTSTA